jgi:hypothetical protein
LPLAQAQAALARCDKNRSWAKSAIVFAIFDSRSGKTRHASLSTLRNRNFDLTGRNWLRRRYGSRVAVKSPENYRPFHRSRFHRGGGTGVILAISFLAEGSQGNTASVSLRQAQQVECFTLTPYYNLDTIYTRFRDEEEKADKNTEKVGHKPQDARKRKQEGIFAKERKRRPEASDGDMT